MDLQAVSLLAFVASSPEQIAKFTFDSLPLLKFFELKLLDFITEFFNIIFHCIIPSEYSQLYCQHELHLCRKLF